MMSNLPHMTALAASFLGELVEADYRVVAALVGVLLILVVMHLVRRRAR
jgi:predicted membrane-bound mannosyltransferase